MEEKLKGSETLTLRLVEALDSVVFELEQLRVLKEYELGVRVEYASEGGGPYIPKGRCEEE